MTLRELQDAIDGWITQFDAGYWSPMANVVRLAEEVGELAREVNHRFGPKTKKPGEAEGDIAAELGDIVYTVAVIANSLDIDLEQVMQQTLKRIDSRDSSRWKRKED